MALLTAYHILSSCLLTLCSRFHLLVETCQYTILDYLQSYLVGEVPELLEYLNCNNAVRIVRIAKRLRRKSCDQFPTPIDATTLWGVQTHAYLWNGENPLKP